MYVPFPRGPAPVGAVQVEQLLRPNLIEKEFQFKTLMQRSLLHRMIPTSNIKAFGQNLAVTVLYVPFPRGSAASGAVQVEELLRPDPPRPDGEEGCARKPRDWCPRPPPSECVPSRYPISSG